MAEQRSTTNGMCFFNQHSYLNKSLSLFLPPHCWLKTSMIMKPLIMSDKATSLRNVALIHVCLVPDLTDILSQEQIEPLLANPGNNAKDFIHFLTL